MTTSLAEKQIANITAPRKSAVIALGVDGTARAYDLTTITLGSAFSGSNMVDNVFLTMQADGDDIWYHFNTATTSTLDDTAKIAAGSALAYATTYGFMLKQGDIIRIRIDRDVDKFICVKCAGSDTAILRFYASSQPL